MATLKLRAIGNSVGVVFPREVLARLKVQDGDSLHVVDTKDGIILTPLNPAVAEQLEAGREVMRRYRDTLSVLAK
jgi:putative addiction module antidote